MDENNRNHNKSLEIKKILEEINETTVINTTVIAETLNRVKESSNDVKKSYEFLKNKNMVISLTKQDYLKSLEINEWFGNSINFNDCTIINTMMALGIEKIVSFDSDFKKIDNYKVIS